MSMFDEPQPWEPQEHPSIEQVEREGVEYEVDDRDADGCEDGEDGEDE